MFAFILFNTHSESAKVINSGGSMKIVLPIIFRIIPCNTIFVHCRYLCFTVLTVVSELLGVILGLSIHCGES